MFEVAAQRLCGLLQVAVLHRDEPELARQHDEIFEERHRSLGAQPPDRVVLTGVTVCVLSGKLAFAEPTQSNQGDPLPTGERCSDTLQLNLTPSKGRRARTGKMPVRCKAPGKRAGAAIGRSPAARGNGGRVEGFPRSFVRNREAPSRSLRPASSSLNPTRSTETTGPRIPFAHSPPIRTGNSVAWANAAVHSASVKREPKYFSETTAIVARASIAARPSSPRSCRPAGSPTPGYAFDTPPPQAPRQSTPPGTVGARVADKKNPTAAPSPDTSAKPTDFQIATNTRTCQRLECW